jgi:hypothetical protein
MARHLVLLPRAEPLPLRDDHWQQSLLGVYGDLLCPLYVDSGRPLRANCGHWATAWRTGPFDPKATFKVCPLNGREAPESGLWLKAQEAPGAGVHETICERVTSIHGGVTVLNPRASGRAVSDADHYLLSAGEAVEERSRSRVGARSFQRLRQRLQCGEGASTGLLSSVRRHGGHERHDGGGHASRSLDLAERRVLRARR